MSRKILWIICLSQIQLNPTELITREASSLHHHHGNTKRNWESSLWRNAVFYPVWCRVPLEPIISSAQAPLEPFLKAIWFFSPALCWTVWHDLIVLELKHSATQSTLGKKYTSTMLGICSFKMLKFVSLSYFHNIPNWSTWCQRKWNHFSLFTDRSPGRICSLPWPLTRP